MIDKIEFVKVAVGMSLIREGTKTIDMSYNVKETEKFNLPSTKE